MQAMTRLVAIAIAPCADGAALLARIPENFYLWAKAIHVIAVISWMAGMLYLPRLFVYHSQVPVGSPQSETFKVMERRLLRAIINPAMIVTWVFGLLARLEGFWLPGRLAARQDRAGACDVRRARLSVRRGAPFRRGPQRKTGAPLAHRQRDTHIADDR